MFKPYLVVSLAGTTVSKGGSTFAQRHRHLMFGNHRTRQRRAQQILVLVDGPGAQSGKDIAAQKLVAQVDNTHLGSAGLMGLFYDGVDVIALADIGDHGDHVAVVVLLEPGNDDGG